MSCCARTHTHTHTKEYLFLFCLKVGHLFSITVAGINMVTREKNAVDFKYYLHRPYCYYTKNYDL